MTNQTVGDVAVFVPPDPDVPGVNWFALFADYLEVSVFFRAPAMTLIFLAFWGLNVFVFECYRLNYATVLNMNRKEQVSGSKIILTALILLAILTFVFVPFSLEEQMTGEVAVEAYFLVFLLAALAFLLAPNGMFQRPAQLWYVRCIYSVINPVHPVDFSSVFIADGLTSLAKVWGDSELFICMVGDRLMGLFKHVTRSKQLALSGCAHNFYFPLFTSLPYLFRARQCWIGYKHSSEGPLKQKHAWGCVKYFTSLPVIWLSAFKRDFPSFGLQLQGPWVFSLVVNSLYSFVWDVVLDFGIFEPSGKSWWRIRKVRHYPAVFYILVIILDFCLRITWSLKLSSHLHLGAAGTTLLFELLELIRRFLWNFLKIEYECIRTGANISYSKVPLVII